MSKINEIIEKATSDILEGKYGKIGSKYMSIRQFASVYGISYVTASKAINQLKTIGVITQNLKSTQVSDCQSRPVSKNQMLLGVHVRDMSNSFYTSLCSMFTQTAKTYGAQLIFMSSNNDNIEKKSVLKRFIELGCDGVINLNSFKEYELADFYKIYPLPQVFFGINPIKNLNSDYVLTDNKLSGKLAAKHLIECGAKKFVYINATASSLEKDDRHQGFKGYLCSVGKNDCFDFQFESDTISSEQYSYIANFLLKQSKDCKIGVFCHHDEFAAKVISICNQKKIKVPENVAILGYDNLQFTEYTSPHISTFSYNFKEIANSIFKCLVSRIKNPSKPSSTIIYPTYLIIRNSTKCNN